MNTRSPSTEIDRPSTSLAEAWILVAGIGGTALIMAVEILAAASSSELGTRSVMAAALWALAVLVGVSL